MMRGRVCFADQSRRSSTWRLGMKPKAKQIPGASRVQASNKGKPDELTLFRREPPPVDWMDRPAAEDRGATPLFVPTPMAGEMERAGMLGGGPGSAPGERCCMERVEPGPLFMTALGLYPPPPFSMATAETGPPLSLAKAARQPDPRLAATTARSRWLGVSAL